MDLVGRNILLVTFAVIIVLILVGLLVIAVIVVLFLIVVAGLLYYAAARRLLACVRRRRHGVRVHAAHVTVASRGGHHGRGVALVMRVVGVLLQLQVVSIVEPFELFLDGVLLPPADGAAARVLLLLLHLLEHRILFDLDERLPLVLAQTQPELLDLLPLLLRARVPYLLLGRWRRAGHRRSRCDAFLARRRLDLLLLLLLGLLRLARGLGVVVIPLQVGASIVQRRAGPGGAVAAAARCLLLS